MVKMELAENTGLESQEAYTKQVSTEDKNNANTHFWEVKSRNVKRDPGLIIWVHGGGYIKPHYEKDGEFAAMFAVETHNIVWDTDLPLAPEHPFPEPVDHLIALYEYAVKHAFEIGINPKKIILLGASSGGNLVLGAAMKISQTDILQPALVIANYPCTDLKTNPADKPDAKLSYQSSSKSLEYNQKYAGGHEGSPYVSMLFAPQEMLRKLPPLLFLTGAQDMLHREGEEFAWKCVQAGVNVQIQRFNGKHGFTTHCQGENWVGAHKLMFERIAMLDIE